ERDGAHKGSDEQFEAVAHRDGVSVRGDVERLGFGHHGNGNGHGSQPDHGVHEGNEFGHFGHFYPTCHLRADIAADQQAQDDAPQTQCEGLGGQADDEDDGGDHGNAHSHHAKLVAAYGGGRVRQPLEGLDEADGGNEIKQGDEV